tara:strand:- start:710 stop:1183 length:474 start_codon:yes stop_codon:yes gene_type:complete
MTLYPTFLVAIVFSLAVSANAAAQDDDGGPPVDGDTREELEGAFGADPSDVRAHTGNGATTLTESASAPAYTNSNAIDRRTGDYSPGDTASERLLRHELTHTVQQQQSVATAEPADGGMETEEPEDAETERPDRARHRDRTTRDADRDSQTRRVRPD